METFKEFPLSNEVLEALDKIEIVYPTEIQVLSIPPMMEGKDIIGQAQTGTGKTFAYAIPIIETVDTKNNNIQALILCPTRELTIQVSVEVKKLIYFKKDIKIATIYGGESYEKQFRALKEKPQIIIGTPGRIIDHLERGTLSFSKLSKLVLDEADEMLKMGFQDDLETILQKAPKERQTALFSATMPPFIQKIALNYQNNPVKLVVEKKTLTVEAIEQKLYYVKKENKKDLLIRLLDSHNFTSCMIFANTKSMVDELVVFLQKNKYLVDGLHGDLKQMVRDRVMSSFRAQNINILIATDVAARGIDVDGIEAIINFDIPVEDEIYVHRIGRTGRAGAKGMSITFASPREQYRIKQIQRYSNSVMSEAKVPSIDEIKQAYQNKMYKVILDKLKEPNATDYTKMINRIYVEGYSANDVISALITIASSKTDHDYKEIDPVHIASHNDRSNNDRSSNDRRSNDRSSNYNKHDISRSTRKYGDSPSYLIQQSQDSKNSSSKNLTKEFVYYKINIGRNDNIGPQMLVTIMNKLSTVRKEHIGDIKIDNDESYVAVAKDGAKFLQTINGKTYNGKKVVLTETAAFQKGRNR